MSKPKVFSYFLFMQEQRKLVPGWANKSNNELQALCDPLWRKLDKAEKEKYKNMKKAHKEKERLEDEKRFASVMRVDIKTKVVVGQVDRPDIVWVTKVKEMEDVQKQLTKSVMVSLPKEEVNVGTVAACKFSGDGEVYRCQVVALQEEEDLVMVRYMDFGNMEKVKKSELCHLPSSLRKMGPVAVRVRVRGMEGVKDNEKNRAKVEKKLGVEELEVSLNREGFATFYDNGKILTFKGSKSKDDSEKESEVIHVEKNFIQKLNDVNDNPVKMVGETLEHTSVIEVADSYVKAASIDDLKSVENEVIQKQEMKPDKEENVNNSLDKVSDENSEVPQENEDFVNCTKEGNKNMVVEVEIQGASPAVVDSDNVFESTEDLIDNTNASMDDKASIDKLSSGYIDDASVGGASVSCEAVADCAENVEKCEAVFSLASSGIGTDEAVVEDDEGDIKVIKSEVQDENTRTAENVVKADTSDYPCDTTAEVAMSAKDKDESKKSVDVTCLGQKKVVSSSKKVVSSSKKVVSSSKRPPVVRKKRYAVKPRKSSSGWQVGDKVVAQWVEDGVWRNGTVHEIVGDMAYVVCKEQLVRAAKVRVDKLRHPTMPVEVLNLLEEELAKDCEEESLDESTTDVSSSVHEVCEDVHQEEFSDDLEELLTLLPSIDIAMLTSPSCSDLLESLVMMIPSLPLSQVERLVDGMMRQDLLIPAAVHPTAYTLAIQLVKYVMVANSNMKGQVMNCLGRHADEMMKNMWGREVLKTLHGYI